MRQLEGPEAWAILMEVSAGDGRFHTWFLSTSAGYAYFEPTRLPSDERIITADDLYALGKLGQRAALARRFAIEEVGVVHTEHHGLCIRCRLLAFD